MIDKVVAEIKKHSNKQFALHHASFFKTQKGGYGEGDLFWGIKVPALRKVSKAYYKEVTLKDVESIIGHKIHEVRLTALFILVEKYKRASDKEKDAIAKIYFKNVKHVNNWDLVDLSAPYIAGEYFYRVSRDIQNKFANSKKLWLERIAMVSTFYSLRNGNLEETFKLAKHFLNHKHDLMHKASGWLLREMGKKDIRALKIFLDKYSKIMPRTMLRYSIEKFPQKTRKKYMEK